MGLFGYIKRYSGIFLADVATSIGLYYLWNKGHKYLVPTVSLCGIGASYLYCHLKSRDKLTSNDVIVITGCGSGLGYSLALYCRQLGATVIAGVLQMDSPSVQKLEDEGVIVFPLDLMELNSTTGFTDSVRRTIAEKRLVLRCVINNAAVMVFGEFEWQTYGQLKNQLEVNFLGAMIVTQELMPIIRAHYSRIIVVSSHCKTQPIPGASVYSGTKAAISAWATGLRVELKKYGIRVVSVVPGNQGSFIKESNIFTRQADHFEAMKWVMPKEVQKFYGEYLYRYMKYFSSLVKNTTVQTIRDGRIYEIFEGALLDRYPSATYKNESWRYAIYHTLFTITPTFLRDRLVERFVHAPAWTKEDAEKSVKSAQKAMNGLYNKYNGQD
ncbi:retinol dehydrogenase 7 isoform X1 [Bombus huntii]|uniref:retinol dehydrogenase 7 isoform X1 n=1 Tax=Bombus huntii TaxID=85661 RepID=UPI0021AA6942|nr:retinol dehydrogenase 7 isoform X1 [Bombus huntii]